MKQKPRNFKQHSLVLLLLTLFAFAPGLGWGQLLDENFNYTSGTLLTANGWTAHSGAGTNAISVTTPVPLTLPGYLSSGIGNEVTMTTNGEDVNKTFTVQSSGIVYASFLVNVTSSQTNGDYFFNFGPATMSTTFSGKIFIKKDATTTNFAFGVTKAANTGASVVYTPFSYVPGVTYMVVLKYTIVTGATNDYAQIYINPTLNAVEPVTGWVSSSDNTAGDLAGIGSIALRQGGTSNAAGLKIDGIRVATTWADIVGVASTPVITVNPLTLNNFTYLGAGPSTEQSFTISGNNLTGDISITAPTNYEISTGTGGSFVATSPITLTQSGGSVTETTLYARLKAGLSIGTYNAESITASTSGGANQTVTCNGFVGGGEPTNHATGFTVGSVASTTLPLTWTDATGAIVPTGYLIKASAVSYDAIVAPADYAAEADGALVKNIAAGVQSVTFTGLTPNTAYYFKIWPYTNTGTYVDYKLDGTVPQQTATTLPLYFRSAASGAWNAFATWEISGDNSNWSAATSEIPIYVSSNVTIRNGHIVEVTDNNGKCADLTIDNGGKLWKNSPTASSYLYVYGNILNNGTIGSSDGGTTVSALGFDIEGANCLISGSGTFDAWRISKFTTTNLTTNLVLAQDITLRYSPASASALYNNAGATTTLNITVNPGYKVTTPIASINLTNGTLTLKSDATGTASLLDNGTILGMSGTNATLERYITGSSTITNMMYHYVSVPLTTGGTSNQFLGSYLFDFNEGTNLWNALGSSSATPLDNTRGYMIYYPGASTTYQFTGALNTGTFTPNVTFAGGGYNLVPNPYPSAIDWNAAGWTKTNIAGSIYYWPAGQPSNNTNYAVWNGTSGTNSGTQYIPVGQAFFVQANAATPVLSMTNTTRVHNAQAFWKSSDAVSNLLRIKSVSLNNNAFDEMIVNFREEATTGFDSQFDANKLQGGVDAPQLNSVASDDVRLAINTLPFSESDVLVPLNFALNASSDVTFTASGLDSFYESISIYLEDKELNTLTDLRAQPVYTFSHNTGSGENRFQLRFKGVTGTPELPETTQGSVFVSQGSLFVDVPAMQQSAATIGIFDALGRQISTRKVVMNGIVKLEAPVATGMYIVRVISGSLTFTGKVVVK